MLVESWQYFGLIYHFDIHHEDAHGSVIPALLPCPTVLIVKNSHPATVVPRDLLSRSSTLYLVSQYAIARASCDKYMQNYTMISFARCHNSQIRPQSTVVSEADTNADYLHISNPTQL